MRTTNQRRKQAEKRQAQQRSRHARIETARSQGAIADRRWDRRPPWELRPDEMLTARQAWMVRKLEEQSPFNDRPAPIERERVADPERGRERVAGSAITEAQYRNGV